MRVLNLYAGIGGNRKLWVGHDVTAVESDPKIAAVYQRLYPSDLVVVGDAHRFLEERSDEFDFVWSSPPCQSHSRMVKATRHKRKRFVDLRLYEEIMFLRHHFKGAWVVENVKPFYRPLVEPSFVVGRHLFWASKVLHGVQDVPRPEGFINCADMFGRFELQRWLGIYFPEVIYYQGNHCPAQVLRNAVHPDLGKAIFDGLAA